MSIVHEFESVYVHLLQILMLSSLYWCDWEAETRGSCLEFSVLVILRTRVVLTVFMVKTTIQKISSLYSALPHPHFAPREPAMAYKTEPVEAGTLQSDDVIIACVLPQNIVNVTVQRVNCLQLVGLNGFRQESSEFSPLESVSSINFLTSLADH